MIIGSTTLKGDTFKCYKYSPRLNDYILINVLTTVESIQPQPMPFITLKDAQNFIDILARSYGVLKGD